MVGLLFVFKQNTAYEMRISDWSSDVCSSDLKRFNMANLGEWGVKPTAPTRGSARIRSGRNGWLGVGAVQAFDVAGQGGDVVGIQLLGDRGHDLRVGVVTPGGAVVPGLQRGFDVLRVLAGQLRIHRARIAAAVDAVRSEEHTSEL